MAMKIFLKNKAIEIAFLIKVIWIFYSMQDLVNQI